MKRMVFVSSGDFDPVKISYKSYSFNYFIIFVCLVSNQIINKINKAKNEYTPCETKNGTCFFPNILNDLDPFKNGITREMITAAADK